MSAVVPLYVFGEVLFDCFPDGARVLGGAPFNVAWHLQAFGDRPRFISRVGDDEAGREIAQAMSHWGMDCSNLQRDQSHPTGRVEVSISGGEPSYEIVADCAYDFIQISELSTPAAPGILYHGSLCLRNPCSAAALAALSTQPGMQIFLDVNLRSPWWQKQQLESLMRAASWVKLNQHELQLLTTSSGEWQEQMAALQERFELEQVILTRGDQGALVRTQNGEFHAVTPVASAALVDTVGAGDAFSAVYIHGLLHGWPIDKILQHAQHFAGRVIGLRGATTTAPEFYRKFLASLDAAVVEG
jgi:fructokinase